MAANRVLVAVTDKSKELANSAGMFLLKRLQPLEVDQDQDLEVDSSQSSNQPLTSKRSAFAFRVVAEEDEEEEDEDDLVVEAAQVVAGDQEGLLLLGAQLLNGLLRLEAEEEKEEEEEGVEDVDSQIKCDCNNYLSLQRKRWSIQTTSYGIQQSHCCQLPQMARNISIFWPTDEMTEAVEHHCHKCDTN